MATMSDLQATFEVQRTLVLVLDLCGTLAFALSGAMAGIRRRLDVFGVLVLAAAASTFGGISRDVLIGATPPAALVDWRYLAVSVAAGLVAFFWSTLIEKLRNPMCCTSRPSSPPSAGDSSASGSGGRRCVGAGTSHARRGEFQPTPCA